MFAFDFSSQRSQFHKHFFALNRFVFKYICRSLAGRDTMPAIVKLYFQNALAWYVVGYNQRWLFINGLSMFDGINKFLYVVTVNMKNVPVECFVFFRHRL